MQLYKIVINSDGKHLHPSTNMSLAVNVTSKEIKTFSWAPTGQAFIFTDENNNVRYR